MIGSKLWTALGAAAAIVVGAALGALEAKAQMNNGFDAQNFKVALDPFAYMTVNGALVTRFTSEVEIAGWPNAQFGRSAILAGGIPRAMNRSRMQRPTTIIFS